MYKSNLIELFYLFFQGALCFQVVVFSILYTITRRRYLLLYSLFLLSSTVYFFLNAPATFFNIPEEEVWRSNWYNLLNEPVIIIMNFFYLLFLRNFYSDIPTGLLIRKIFGIGVWIAPVLFILFVILTITEVNSSVIFFGVNIISVIPAIAVIMYAVKCRLPYSRLLLLGLSFYVAGTLLTMLMNVLRTMEVKHLFTFGYPLIFIRLGILGDMFFLLLVILKKWHWQEKQLAVAEITAQLNVEKLRYKISMELHDDVGATLSGLGMYGHLAKEQLHNQQFEKVLGSLAVIQNSSVEMVNKLNDIVWLTNPSQDSLDKLIQYLEEYARKMAQAKDMEVRVCVSQTTKQYQLTMEQRQNIYLFCKEAINNAVKYSEGILLELEVKDNGSFLEFSVRDNGNGFDPEKVKRGNGLNNLQQRAEEMGAAYTVVTGEGRGSTISLQLKIT